MSTGISSISPGSPYQLPVLSPDEVTDCFMANFSSGSGSGEVVLKQSVDCFLANNSSGDNIITLTPDESGLIDLGLAEFHPSSTETMTPEFDLSFLVTDDGSNTVRDGSCSSNAGDHAEENDNSESDENDDYDDTSSEESETDTCHCSESSDNELENAEEELEQLCSITNKLIV